MLGFLCRLAFCEAPIAITVVTKGQVNDGGSGVCCTNLVFDAGENVRIGAPPASCGPKYAIVMLPSLLATGVGVIYPATHPPVSPACPRAASRDTRNHDCRTREAGSFAALAA